MSKAQRTKGKRVELAAARYLRDVTGDHTIRRNLDQTRDGGHDLLGDSLDGRVNVEVKASDHPRLAQWFEQMEPAPIKMVLLKRTRKPFESYILFNQETLEKWLRNSTLDQIFSAASFHSTIKARTTQKLPSFTDVCNQLALTAELLRSYGRLHGQDLTITVTTSESLPTSHSSKATKPIPALSTSPTARQDSPGQTPRSRRRSRKRST